MLSQRKTAAGIFFLVFLVFSPALRGGFVWDDWALIVGTAGFKSFAPRNLAWMLATHPDPGVRNGEEALQLARRTCDATGNQAPNFLDTLAAACAETGRFAEAVTVARRAVDLMKASGDQPKLRELENRLRLYELGQPFHERGRKAEEAR